ALHQVRNAAGELDDLEAALHRAFRVGEHLAVLGGHEQRELVHVLLDQLLEAEHDARARDGRGLRPAGEGLFRHADDALDLALGGERHSARQRAGRGVEYIAEAAALAFHMLAADEMGELADLRERWITGIHGWLFEKD